MLDSGHKDLPAIHAAGEDGVQAQLKGSAWYWPNWRRLYFYALLIRSDLLIRPLYPPIQHIGDRGGILSSYTILCAIATPVPFLPHLLHLRNGGRRQHLPSIIFRPGYRHGADGALQNWQELGIHAQQPEADADQERNEIFLVGHFTAYGDLDLAARRPLNDGGQRRFVPYSCVPKERETINVRPQASLAVPE